MHAVVVKVSISDVEVAQKSLEETIIPRVSQAPGFIAGYWTRSDDKSNGQAMIVFESEEVARSVADRIRGDAPEEVTVESIEVREVVANA
jgi:hypothetical protein